MSHKTNFDTISFQYPGSVGEYHEEFTLPNDKYYVTLSPNLVNTSSYVLRKATTSATANLYELTIKWNKLCRKFIRIKVYDLITNKFLLKKKILRISKTCKMHKYFMLENKPAVCVLEIYTYETISKIKQPLAEPRQPDFNMKCIKKEFEQLSNDFEALFNSCAFSDVTITIGEKKMYLHKLVLSARSSVFKNMFQHPTKEIQEGLIKITDIPFDVFGVLVEYMYKGVVVIDGMEMARNLFIAACNYDVQSLKEICLAKLKCVSLDNVLDNLLLSNSYGEKDLKSAALDYISDNYGKVQNLQQWIEFMNKNKDLAIEIFEYVLDKKTEK